MIKEDFGYVWRPIKPIAPLVNTERSKFLRQDYALFIIDKLVSGVTIANYDESIFNESTCKRYSFAPAGKTTGRTFLYRHQPINLLACALSDGSLYYKMTTGTHN